MNRRGESLSSREGGGKVLLEKIGEDQRQSKKKKSKRHAKNGGLDPGGSEI